MRFFSVAIEDTGVDPDAILVRKVSGYSPDDAVAAAVKLAQQEFGGTWDRYKVREITPIKLNRIERKNGTG